MEDMVLKMLGEITGVGDGIGEDMDIDLFESRLIDSLGMIELLIAIDEIMGLKIQPTEIERSEIGTPRKLIAYLEARKGNA